MKRAILFNFLFFLALGALGQTYKVRGIVTDQAGETLPYANVFFAETTYGTTTNQEGNFELIVPKAGTYDLIVRFIGYKTYAAQLKLNELNEINLNIVLEEDAVNLGSFTVTDKKDSRWRYNLQEFKGVFLGTTLNASRCKILNEEDIDFIDDVESSTLEAFARGPIIIENKALGYRIKYYLENFAINYKTGLAGYVGYTSFEELKGNTRQQRRWEGAREKAYNGSITHFFSSLYENRLAEEGFDVNLARDIEGIGRVLNPQQAALDTVLLEGESDLSRKLPFENFIYITYKNEEESPEYKQSSPLQTSKHTSISRVSKEGQLSWIAMLDGFKDIEFEGNGYIYNPVSFYSSGYWGYEKIAEMVPINYRPKQ